jgi:preprotein translocase subunit SecF
MVDLVGKRKYFFALSILLILAGIIGLIVNGLELDIQFQGGSIIRVQMPDDQFDETLIADSLSQTIGKQVSGQKSRTYNPENADDAINMLVLKVSSRDTLTGDELNKVFEVLERDYGMKTNAERDIQSVAPFLGKEMMNKGLRAVVISLALIILYMWFRFRLISGLTAAVVAVIALLHDTAIMMAVYSIFRLPLNESFIAAVLTILGYSMNDTIIVYDRVRENSRIMKKMPLEDLVNVSIIQTLSRSINTLVTTLISIVTIYIFASVFNITSIKEFTFPLIIGLISGAYSSIFIAGPIWMMWKKSRDIKKVSGKAR